MPASNLRPGSSRHFKRCGTNPAAIDQRSGNSRVVDSLKAVAHAQTNKFFLNKSFKDQSLKKIEAVGFGPDAVEVQAFMLGLGVISQIDSMIAKAEKRLMKFLEELEVSYKTRTQHIKQVAEEAIKQAAAKE